MSPTQSNNNQPNNQNDITSLVARIDMLIETINKKFDDVRNEMRSNMDKYVLNAVHELEIKRLDEKDADQEAHLQRLEDRVLSQGQRYFLYACSAAGMVSALVGVLHLLHIL